MRKTVLPVVVVSALMILGLLIWNVYLVNEVERLQKEQEDLELKNQMLEGDNDILSYDLVTTRDSVRILNKQLEKIDSLK